MMLAAWIFQLFAVATAAAAEPSFVLLGPKVFQKGSDETVCLSLYNATKEGNATLELKLSDQEIRTYHFELVSTDCVVLSIPDVETSSEGTLSFTAFLAGHPKPLTGEKKVQLREPSLITLIQTDKPWYKPGQLVRFRALSLDYQLKPVPGEFNQIVVEDPTGVIIELWKNVSTREGQGLVQKEVQLSAEPVQGEWKIRLTRGTTVTEKEFSVKEFELPRFEVQLKAPSKFSREQTELEFELCARPTESLGRHFTEIKFTIFLQSKNPQWLRYTYGQPVQMSYKVAVSRALSYSSFWFDEWPKITSGVAPLSGLSILPEEPRAEEITILEGKVLGCTSITANITSAKDTYGHGKIGILAIATEDGTDVSFNTTAEVNLEYHSRSIELSGVDEFKVGIPVAGTISLSSTAKDSVAGSLLSVCISGSSPVGGSLTETLPDLCQNFTTDGNGKVSYSFIPVDPNITSYTVKAQETSVGEGSRGYGQKSLRQVYAPSGRSLAFVPIQQTTTCGQKLSINLMFRGQIGDKWNLHWQVVSRGDIGAKGNSIISYDSAAPVDIRLQSNLLALNDNSFLALKAIDSLRTFEVTYKVKDTDGPKLNFFAYAVTADGEVLTADTRLDVQSCFPNKVELAWLPASRKPGEKVQFSVSGHPGSFCGISVVDKSVTLLKPEAQLQESNVLDKLSDYVINTYEHPRQQTPDYTYCPEKLKTSNREKRSFYRRWHWQPYETYHVDPIAAFDNAGLFVMSNLNIETRPCTKREIEPTIHPYYARPGVFLTTSFNREVMKAAALPDIMPIAFPMKATSDEEPTDLTSAVENAGIFVLSNLVIESRPCVERNDTTDYETEALDYAVPELAFASPDMVNRPMPVFQAEALGAGAPVAISDMDVADLTSAVEVRTYFPETWLWDSFTISSTGSHQEALEAPHTITNWVGRAICVSSEVGFGMSPSVELQVFQLLFVEMNLPYSVKRGETLLLKVAVFNYASRPLPVIVTMSDSVDFDIVGRKARIPAFSSNCVQPQGKAIYKFRIKPKVLGEVNVTVTATVDSLLEADCGHWELPTAKDAVVKPLLVIPEGIPQEKTYSAMICPKDFDADNVTVWDVTTPSRIVEGSARGWITINGDLLGPAVTGLGSLVRMPTGCGEQNMVIFTPIVYVLQYLKATNQVDPKLLDAGVGYLKTGYQRELTYRHDDGSFSAFGKSDASGSMWLTAFVVRSFAGAKPFISIDAADFEKSAKWILSKQMENGCFPSIGKVLHSKLKGGIKDDDSPIGLTAFVVASLVEAKIWESQESLKSAINCLTSETNQTNYVLSLTAYALAKSGNIKAAEMRMKTLMERARQETGLLWWEQGESKSLAVEMTAYNIMTLVLLGETLQARTAVRWLSKHRNGNGGFISTQDTVVGLQAMAFYASGIAQTEVNMAVTIDAKGLDEALQVIEDRKLVQRQFNLPTVPTTVEIDAAGEGCILAQAVLRYNIPIDREREAFNVSAEISSDLELSGCVKFSELNDISNMAVVDIELLSGQIAKKESVARLKENAENGIKRVEVKEGHVYLYYDELDAVGRCFNLDLEEEFVVADLKPGSVVAYDYYATEKRGTAELPAPSPHEVP